MCPRQTQKGRRSASFVLCLVTVLDDINLQDNQTNITDKSRVHFRSRLQ